MLQVRPLLEKKEKRKKEKSVGFFFFFFFFFPLLSISGKEVLKYALKLTLAIGKVSNQGETRSHL